MRAPRVQGVVQDWRGLGVPGANTESIGRGRVLGREVGFGMNVGHGAEAALYLLQKGSLFRSWANVPQDHIEDEQDSEEEQP